MKYATFQKLIEGCQKGDPIAWDELTQKYSALLQQRFLQYFPGDKGEKDAALEDYIQVCRSELRLAQCSHLNEREFTLFLVFDFLEYCRDRFPHDDSDTAALSDLRSIFKGMPLAYQKCVFLLLEEYPKDLIQSIFRVGPVMTYGADEELKKRLAAKRGPKVRINLVAKERMRQAKSVHCEAERLLGNLIEGSLPWEERERIQTHLLECLHCLQNLVMWEEVGHFFRINRPVQSARQEGKSG